MQVADSTSLRLVVRVRRLRQVPWQNMQLLLFLLLWIGWSPPFWNGENRASAFVHYSCPSYKNHPYRDIINSRETTRAKNNRPRLVLPFAPPSKPKNLVVLFLNAEDEAADPHDNMRSSSSNKNNNETQVLSQEEGEEDEDDVVEGIDNHKTVVTKEMFLREMLADPPVVNQQQQQQQSMSRNNNNNTSTNNNHGIARKKRKDYKVLDNRDLLPFAVQLTTPDPYTHPDVKKRRQAKVKKRRDTIEQSIIPSKIYKDDVDGIHSNSNNNNNNDSSLLGEFQLDKYTTTGDLLVLGDDGKQYRVVKHRCLYKYAGGQRFVMVKKILQVKEVGRLQTEEYLARQWKNSNQNNNNNNNNNIWGSGDGSEL